jgi:hypothetical protein
VDNVVSAPDDLTRRENRMKAMLGLAGLALLTGCHGGLFDPPEITQCEKYILAKLKPPRSYKRVQVDSLGIPFQKPEYWTVGIAYDTVDAHNATVHDSQVCDFPLANGKPDTSKYIDFDRDNFKRFRTRG